MKLFLSYIFGIIFAVGLGVSGMTMPSKVLAFLTIGEHWDPSLIFVMIGGIATYSLGFFFIKNKNKPVFEEKFLIPLRGSIDKKLILGSALFGIGWGLGGYCPGPALTSLPTGGINVLGFTVAMIIGMLVFNSSKSFRKGLVIKN